MELIDIPKELFADRYDINVLEESSAIVESIKNQIISEILDNPLDLKYSLSAKQMILKAYNTPEVRYIIFKMKEKIEELDQVKNCEISYTNNQYIKTIDIELLFDNIISNDKLPVNLVIRI